MGEERKICDMDCKIEITRDVHGLVQPYDMCIEAECLSSGRSDVNQG